MRVLLLMGLSVLVGCGGGGPSASRSVTAPAPSEEPKRPPGLYRDVTDAAGIEFLHVTGARGRKLQPETMGSGGCVLDFDGDGWMDVYLVQSGYLEGGEGGNPPNRLYRNLGDGTFRDVTEGSGLEDRSYGQGAVAADFDGDGDPDVYVTNFGANRLFRNDGEGRFTDVTEESGTGNAEWGTSASAFDGDGDGDLDLYVVNYLEYSVAGHQDCAHDKTGELFYCHPDVYPRGADVYYENRGDLHFVEATDRAGLTDETGKGLGVVAADFDNDGHPDLYVANDSTPNFLYLNQGDGTFFEEGLFRGVAYNEEGLTEAGMGIDAGDVDGNGYLDIFVTNLSLETNSLYLNGPDDFGYATRRLGLYEPSYSVLGFGTDLLDVDNDGDLDIFVANGDVLDNIELFNDSVRWKQKGQVFVQEGERFRELSPEELGDPSEPRVGRGSMTLDFDNDGRLDVLVSYNGDRARLFRNVAPLRHWVGLSLVAKPPNREAVGARVFVESGGRTQMDEVKAGSSYLVSADPRIHFGLGDAEHVERLEVRWPDGSRQTFDGFRADRYYGVVQGQDVVVELP